MRGNTHGRDEVTTRRLRRYVRNTHAASRASEVDPLDDQIAGRLPRGGLVKARSHSNWYLREAPSIGACLSDFIAAAATVLPIMRESMVC